MSPASDNILYYSKPLKFGIKSETIAKKDNSDTRVNIVRIPYALDHTVTCTGTTVDL